MEKIISALARELNIKAKQAEAKKNASFLDRVLEKIGLKRI